MHWADRCIDKALNGVHSAKATASRTSDLDAIRALIQSKPGGFEVLDSTVKRHLSKWVEGKGAVRSAERVLRSGSHHPPTSDWSGGSERMAITLTGTHTLDYLDSTGHTVNRAADPHLDTPLHEHNPKKGSHRRRADPYRRARGAGRGHRVSPMELQVQAVKVVKVTVKQSPPDHSSSD